MRKTFFSGEFTMSKININKGNDLEAIRAARQTDIYQVAKNSSQKVENKVAVSEDKLELSERAAEVGKLVDQVKQLPDVRTEKVNDLKVQISAGEYKPTSDEIAKAILKDEVIK
jgi:negative regulator of flagellin synthesis FlgM